MDKERNLDRVLVQPHSRLYRLLQWLATHQRMVFFAGLPGTGKSLLIHQLAHLAAAHGRAVHLLMWDVARPAVEAHPVGQRYPARRGVTHAVIRKALGLWVRHTLVAWHQKQPEFEPLLIGETPFIGNRFVELAARRADEAEALLIDRSSVFVVPVPSLHVRRAVESERQRRNAEPQHERETEDAPPHVLRALWQEVLRVAPLLGAEVSDQMSPTTYHPLSQQPPCRCMISPLNPPISSQRRKT